MAIKPTCLQHRTEYNNSLYMYGVSTKHVQLEHLIVLTHLGFISYMQQCFCNNQTTSNQCMEWYTLKQLWIVGNRNG